MELIERHKHCVLATSSPDGKPEAALIEYANEEMILYFETLMTNRKFGNLIYNPQVSIVITDGESAVQMDGTVSELGTEERAHAEKLLIAKHGEKKWKILEHPDCAVFKFTPSWARLQHPGWPPKYEMILGKY